MAAPVIIENPILNSPLGEPDRHFRFDDTGITNEIENTRRTSSYFIPIPKPRKSNQKNLVFDTDWTESQKQETKLVNDIRHRVGMWRQSGHVGITPITARLLQYWTAPEREKKLFFCQIEAMETLIYLTEVAHKYGDGWIDNQLCDENEQFNSGLPRLGVKMATGSGKTVVMGMIIAWQSINKLNSPQDARFSDAFLIVTPGITIRDRLRVLLPNDPDNYYKQRDLLPPELSERLNQAKIVITNFHAFKSREKYQAAKNTKSILGVDKTGAFTESPEQMVRRVCRELGNKKNIIVLNDEAHHCYQNKPSVEDELDAVALTGEDRVEAKKRDEEARVWFTGLQAVKKKMGIRGIYDLSATPFFLRGSSYKEGTIFPWVVSDFSLIDAIECGIVKVPRVPVSDNAILSDLRDAHPHLRDRIAIVRDDANTFLLERCQLDWSRRRAVVFLYPYGMHVRWETITAIAKTKAIDLWFLFPLGVAVNRILTCDPKKIDKSLAARLDELFGEPNWRTEFYKTDPSPGLFGDDPRIVKDASFKAIEDYFQKRLGSIFTRVASNPLRLYNSKNVPLFLLCFAAGNPKGADKAIRIAEHILKPRKLK